MIRAPIERIWQLPWPSTVRNRVQKIAQLRVVRLLLFPHFTVGVVGVIQNQRGEFLLLRHTYRGATPWGLPTGFLEHGEQPVDALRREIREESGLAVDLGPVWHTYVDSSRTMLNVVFRGSPAGGIFQASTEISDFRFFPLDELPALMPGQEGLMKMAHREEVPH